MRAYDHRAIGDAATGGALVNIGGESADERFMLSFGDVVALSGDFFRPGGSPMSAPGHWQATRREAETSGRLFSLGRTPGEAGTRLDSRDEIYLRAEGDDRRRRRHRPPRPRRRRS